MTDKYKFIREIISVENSIDLFAADKNQLAAFEKLKQVKDIDGLKKWLNTEVVIDQNGVRVENVILKMKKYARNLNNSELAEVAGLIQTINEAGLDKALHNEFNGLSELRKTKDDSSIVLFKDGEKWFTFGNDADWLFEKKGWQTAELNVIDKKISWMDINQDGKAVLEKENVIIDTIDNACVNIITNFVDSTNSYFSLSQQTLDFFRKLCKEKNNYLGIDYSFSDDIFNENITYRFMHITPNSIDILTTSGKKTKVVDGNNWNVATADVADFLQRRRHYVIDALTHPEEYIFNKKKIADMAVKEFKSYPKSDGEILILKQDDFYISYGDDAIKIAELTGCYIWQRETKEGKCLPMVILSSTVVDYLEYSNPTKILVKEGVINECVTEILAKESILNKGLRNGSLFDNIFLFKKKNGEYAIRATYDGKELESRNIKSKYAIQYNNISSETEKKLLLKSLIAEDSPELTHQKTLNKGKIKRHI